jgi:hypothetical protein
MHGEATKAVGSWSSISRDRAQVLNQERIIGPSSSCVNCLGLSFLIVYRIVGFEIIGFQASWKERYFNGLIAVLDC